MIGRMKDENHPENEYFHAPTEHGLSRVPYYLTIASKIDNSWTDVFWTTAKQKALAEDKDHTVDPYFLRFINRYLLNHHIIYAKGSVAEIENSDTFRELYGPLGNDTNLRYQQFNAYEPLITSKVITGFERLLDNLQRHQETIRLIIRPVWDLNDEWFLFDDKINQTQRILFLSVALYLEQYEFEPKRFTAWIRVCWNIMIDPDIRSVGAMINAMRTISRLSIGGENIYAFFETDMFERLFAETNNIHSEQLSEERQKALLFKEAGWEALIFKAEAHYLFQGNIGFLLSGYPSLSVFSLRVSNAFQIFDRTGANRTFRPDHGVYRYVISSLKKWQDVNDLTYIDDYRTWQLGLRRNGNYRTSIAELCSYPNNNEIHKQIDVMISRPSTISASDIVKMRKVHENLYQQEAFVRWTQKTEKVSKVKWLYDHIYIIRPSAWYDKVMIEGFRNEVVSKFLKLIKFNTEHRCGTAEMFWGEDIDVGLLAIGRTYLVHFDKNLMVSVSKKEGTTEGPILTDIFKGTVAAVKNDMEAQNLAEQIINALTTSISQDEANASALEPRLNS